MSYILYYSFDFYPIAGQYQYKSTQSYFDNSLGLSFQYPASWTKIPLLQTGVAFVSTSFSPNASVASFLVMVLDIDPYISLMDFANGLVDYNSKQLTNFYLTSPQISILCIH